MSNVKQRMDIYFDHRAPSIVVEVEEYRNGYIDIRRRGGKIRAFTQITEDNIYYCKELMKLVDELRHLDGVKGGIAVSESEYMATTVLQESQPLTQVIYSNVKEVVEQGQYIFDTFWNMARSAEQKIKEIEEGIIHYETRIINNPDEIIKEIARLTASSNELCTCLTSGGLLYSYNHFFEIKKKLLDKYKRGEHKGIRYITSIDSENIKLSKIYLDHGVRIRHLKNLPPMSFGVSDKEIAVTIEKMENGKMVQSLLISTEPNYVTHFTSIFEELWKNGIDANYRIKDIEQGIDTEGIEVIQNPNEIQKLVHNLIKEARHEVLGIFSTANAFHRQEYAGTVQLIKEIVKERGIDVRILTPKDDSIQQAVERWKKGERGEGAEQQEIGLGLGPGHISNKINVRFVEPQLQTKVSILVIDKKYSLVVELRDDTKETTEEAIGLATYSNSKSTVLSYSSIFESLWKQTEVYQKLNELYEQLKIHDKMQKEFINIAAHELRTPIQPILGLADILHSKIDNDEQREYLDVIIRNAKRLQVLTENILDASKIESHSLILKKEIFDLNKAIVHVITDYKNQIKNADDIKIVLESKGEFLVDADQARITQVISNL